MTLQEFQQIMADLRKGAVTDERRSEIVRQFHEDMRKIFKKNQNDSAKEEEEETK